jgi:hypothetical protein
MFLIPFRIIPVKVDFDLPPAIAFLLNSVSKTVSAAICLIFLFTAILNQVDWQ